MNSTSVYYIDTCSDQAKYPFRTPLLELSPTFHGRRMVQDHVFSLLEFLLTRRVS